MSATLTQTRLKDAERHANRHRLALAVLFGLAAVLSGAAMALASSAHIFSIELVTLGLTPLTIFLISASALLIVSRNDLADKEIRSAELIIKAESALATLKQELSGTEARLRTIQENAPAAATGGNSVESLRLLVSLTETGKVDVTDPELRNYVAEASRLMRRLDELRGDHSRLQGVLHHVEEASGKIGAPGGLAVVFGYLFAGTALSAVALAVLLSNRGTREWVTGVEAGAQPAPAVEQWTDEGEDPPPPPPEAHGERRRSDFGALLGLCIAGCACVSASYSLLGRRSRDERELMSHVQVLRGVTGLLSTPQSSPDGGGDGGAARAGT